jgi:TM2 domain-containing membrane protein YozV
MYRIIGINGQQYGPVTAEQLRRWITENRANAQSLVQVEGTQDWKPLSTFAEFAADLKATPPPPISAPGSGLGAPPVAEPFDPEIASRASSKIPAGICGILLGGLGIHKFILGYTGPGLILLLVSILTCGLAWPITHIIGLIEGIIYLTKSDREFVRLYVDGRRDWF